MGKAWQSRLPNYLQFTSELCAIKLENIFEVVDFALFDTVLSTALFQQSEQELHPLRIFANEAVVTLRCYESP